MRERLLKRLAKLAVERPAAVLVAAGVISLVAVALLPRLHVMASRFALIAPEGDERARTEAFEASFGRRADLVAAVEGEPEASRAAADALALRLAEHQQIAQVLHRVELEPAQELYWLEPAQIEALASLPPDATAASIASAARRGLSGETEATLDTLDEEGGAPALDRSALPLLTATLRELAAWLREPDRERLALLAPASPALPVDAEGYLRSDDGRTLYLFASPREATDRYEYVAPLTREARAISAEIADAHGVTIAFTGYPAIAADEIDAIRNGSFVTGLVAALLVMGLFAFGFRSPGGVIVAGAPLAVGILWAFGAIAIAVGELNLLTQVAAPVFVGLGIDFAIHLLAAYDGARRAGQRHAPAIEAAMLGAGKGILSGGLTTAAAFGSLGLAEYRAFAQLGVAASIGLLLVMAAVLTITPALLTIGEHRAWPWLQVGGAGRPPLALSQRWIDRLTGAVVERPWRGLGLAVALCALAGAAVFLRPLGFDADVEALMPHDAESIVAGRRMVEGSGFSNEHLGARVSSLEEARTLAARLDAQPTVGRVESAAALLPPGLEARRAAIDAARGATPAPAPDAEPLDEALQGLAVEARRTARELRTTSAEAAAPLRELAEAAEDARAALEGSDRSRVADFDAALSARASRAHEGLAAEPRPPSVDDLPPSLRARLVSDAGFAVYAYPEGDVFEALDAFNAEVREVAPEAVGYPVQFASFLSRMQQSLSRASLVALALVLVILWADFRRLSDALLSLVPVALGLLWLWGLAAAFGIDPNLANVAALPLIVGIGVDDGVHLLHRTREHGAVRPALASVWAALVLTTATTIAGFGTIGLAPHRGMQSFALVMVLGASGCLFATLVVLPALLRLRERE